MKLGIEISMEVKKQKKLEYPFSSRPKNGELLNVKGGIHWLRMPLPITLNHINLWLLEGDEGFTIIDSGMSTDEAKDIWRNIFNGFIPPKKIEEILITHMHLDHSGLSGWLSSELNIAPHFTKKEYNETQKIIGGMTDDQIDQKYEQLKKSNSTTEIRFGLQAWASRFPEAASKEPADNAWSREVMQRNRNRTNTQGTAPVQRQNIAQDTIPIQKQPEAENTPLLASSL